VEDEEGAFLRNLKGGGNISPQQQQRGVRTWLGRREESPRKKRAITQFKLIKKKGKQHREGR